MAEKEFIPSPVRLPDKISSPTTPDSKKKKMGSPDRAEETTESAEKQSVQSRGSAPVEQPEIAGGTIDASTTPTRPLAEHEDDDELEADDGSADSAFGSDGSDSTSISSSIYEGYTENGRRYQSKREGEYWGPSDEKQFESMEKGHLVNCILDSEQSNPSFYAPIPKTAQNILDIGTGNGDWVRDVGDRLPSAFVQGVDLSPVPDNWIPPNCKFEVDDILKRWEFKENGRFSLIHLRYMMGAFSDEQWRLVYKQAYNNLAPGGWIEQLEPSISFRCDDGTVPADSVTTDWGEVFMRCAAKSGRKLDTEEHFKSRIEAAGFTNVHEKLYKVPIGEWTKDPLLKEAGRFHRAQMLQGLEGYALFLLTHFGEPTPWTPEEVLVYVAKARNDLNNPKYHIYQRFRRVWAQKPYESEKKVETKG